MAGLSPFSGLTGAVDDPYHGDMTIIRDVETRLHQLSTMDDTQSVREHLYQTVFTHALSDLFAHLGQPSEQDIILLTIDPTVKDEKTSQELVQIKTQIAEQYTTALDAHLTAKKAWSQAMNRVYQVQASEKATEKQMTAADEAEQIARIPFEQTLETFMQARRAEEAFRHAPAAYEAQSLPAIIWLTQHILRVHTYTPLAGNLTADLLRLLP